MLQYKNLKFFLLTSIIATIEFLLCHSLVLMNDYYQSKSKKLLFNYKQMPGLPLSWRGNEGEA